MGNLKGRTLQAYFDGPSLRAWKSQGYNFEYMDNVTRSRRINAFVQHMTNGPVGNTFGGEEVVPDCSGGVEERRIDLLTQLSW